MSGALGPSLQRAEAPDLDRLSAEVDPLATMPLPARGPVEPSDFLARLEEAMRASAATVAWVKKHLRAVPFDD
ncbi:hypothetical protein [Amnibacterium kyonggiense]|uniref:Uncharacterized protein n=1 Tax=Amnibacterium kyonggiense TaxID=595671 RepID=A0A4R7FIW7_9MICO|nr:hypothetical protein [Amnibacterium kyonggiense]TDS74902.1 hypothetical protein CLV52_3424 [Amnibacterium kyonggiense]